MRCRWASSPPQDQTNLNVATNSSTTTAPGVGAAISAERAANLFGRQAATSDNQQIGKISDLVVDLESGHMLYAIVNTSKGKVGVPPQLFGASTDKTVSLNAPSAKVQGAPQFTSDLSERANLASADYVAKVYQYFGQPAWWGSAGGGSFHNVNRLSKLIGMKVQNVNNQSIGKISNVVVDMPAGRLLYAVLTPDSSLNQGNNLFALPPEALTLSSDQKNLVTDLTPEKLASAPHFDKNQWPNLADASFASQVYQFYGKQAWFQNGAGLQPTGR